MSGYTLRGSIGGGGGSLLPMVVMHQYSLAKLAAISAMAKSIFMPSLPIDSENSSISSNSDAIFLNLSHQMLLHLR